MSETVQGRCVVTVASRVELRRWLSANGTRTDGIWLATYKKSHPDYLAWPTVVEELLCWGWIDAVTRKIDEQRSAHLVSPRRAGSAWSAVNKRLVAQARDSGAMTAAGERIIALAEADGSWRLLDEVEAGVVPDDLAQALADRLSVWEAWPRSVRRGTLEWLKSAKRPDTRQRRIADIVDSAAQGLRPSIFRR